MQRTTTEYRADTSQEDQRDELLALYQALWHLKDWLKNDPAVPDALRRAVESWVNHHPDASNLRVAADVANGSKHMLLTNGRAGGSIHQGTDIRILVGGGLSQTFYIEDRSDPSRVRRREASNLAASCIREWRRFLREGGLRVPNRPHGT